MASSLGSSVLDLTVDSSKLDSGLAQAESNTKARMGRIGGLIGKAAKAATAAFVAGGAAAVAAAFKTAAYGDEIAKTAPKLGITTDALQEFNYWAERNGVSSSNMERALGRLNQRIGDGTVEGSKYAEKLNEMGVATLDAAGNIRETEDVFADTIMALQGIEEPSMRSAMAAEIFGTKLARDLMPALQDTALSIDEARAMAHELGLVMDGDALEASERFQDGWADIKDQIAAFTREAAIPLMTFMADTVFPVISDGIGVLRRLFDAFQEGRESAEGFGQAAGMIGDGLGALFGRLLEAVQNIFGHVVDWLTSGGLEMIFNALLAARERLFDAAMRLFPVIIDAIVEIVPQLLSFIVTKMIPQLIETVVDALPQLLEAAILLFTTLLDAIVDVLPGLLELWYTVVVPAVLEAVLDMVPQLLDAAVTAFFALLDAVMVVLPDLISLLFTEVLPAVVLTILDMLPDILEAAISAFFALVSAVIEILPELLAMLFGTVLPAIVKTLFRMIPRLFSAAVTVFMELVKGIFSIAGSVVSAVFDIGSRMVSTVLGVGRRLFDAGRNIIRQLIDGIKSMFGAVGSAMGDLGGRIRNFLPFSPAKEGPLSGGGSPDRAGQTIADMVADGIIAGEQDVALAMRRITHMDVDVSAMGRGMPMDRRAGAPGIVVNVEGAIDPENTARTILRTLRDAERRSGDRLRV